MSLYQVVVKMNDSKISFFSKKTTIPLIGKIKLVVENGVFEIVGDGKDSIDISELTILKGSYCFTKKDDKVPKVRLHNLKKTYEVSKELFQYLKKNEFNCLESNNDSEILETVGDGEFVINCYREYRFLKRYLDLRKCKLVVYKSTANIKTTIPISYLRYMNEPVSIKDFNELKFFRKALSRVMGMQLEQMGDSNQALKYVVQKQFGPIGVILRKKWECPITKLIGFSVNVDYVDDLGLKNEYDSIMMELTNYAEIVGLDYKDIPQEYLEIISSEIKNKDFFKKMIGSF